MEQTVTEGRTVLVTGASRGWGRAIALRLSQPASHVVVNYVANQTAAEEVVAAAQGRGAEASAVRADVGTPEGVEAVVDHLRTVSDRLDVLVHNAYAHVTGTPPTVDTNTLDRAWLVGPVAANRLIQQTMSLVPDRGGRIVLTGSVATNRVFSRQGTGYFPMALAKAAEEVLVRYWAVELAERAITVNMVVAGWIETEYVQENIKGSMREGIYRKTPMGRLAEPEEMADVVAFLSSPQSSWVTGQILVADGGLTLL